MNDDVLIVFAQQVRDRLDASPLDDGGERGYPRRRWTDALKYIFDVQMDASAYVARFESDGLTPADCNIIAGIHERKGALEETLLWVDRGLSCKDVRMDTAVYELKERRRMLLIQLGHIQEAIDHSWSAFRLHPDKYKYEELMELVPADQRDGWHERAMAVSEGAELWSAVGLFIATSELDRCVARIDRAPDEEFRQAYYRWVLEPAKILSKSYPSTAARLYVHLALSILDERKDKLYGTALQYLEHARDLYKAAGDESVWKNISEDIRHAHRRKQRFMTGFEKITSGGPAKESIPSIIDRARKNWPRGRS